MSIRLRPAVALLCLVIAMTITASYRLRAAAGSPQPAADPMVALLGEVHALRLAMEQSASVTPRMHLTVSCLNMQEQRVTHLASQLDQVRRELSAAVLESQKLSDRLAEDEGSLLNPDEKIRRAAELEVAALKRMMANQSRLLQDLRTRENEAAQALASEQSRWIDLNARLDELERLLVPPVR